MEFIDPHFHYLDFTDYSTTGHNTTYLGPLSKRFPTYLPVDYMNDMKQTGMILKKAVFVEVISDNPLAEAKWVLELCNRSEEQGIIHGIVAYAKLQDPNVEDLLKEYAKYPTIKGIRQIVGIQSWPIDADLLTNADWQKGYTLLAKYHLSFDLVLTPHQLETAVVVIAQHPKIPVIVNHLGTPKLGESLEEDTQVLATWRAGMKALSALPHVMIKLSMLSYIKPGWETDSSDKKKFIRDIVHEVISLFGSNRCMIGSNFPVDAMGASASDLYGALREIVSDLSQEQQHDLFYATADRAYRLGMTKFLKKIGFNKKSELSKSFKISFIVVT